MTQCKDIPDEPILRRIWDINRSGHWAFRYWSEHGFNENCPLDAFPDGQNTPDKLVVAKMKKLMTRGLVDGCSCGCRGDYVVTKKGCDLIGRPGHGHWAYDGVHII